MVHRRQFGNREFRLTASRSGRRETVNAPSGRVDRSRRLRRRRLARRVALGRCRIRRRIADGRKRVVPWSRRTGLHEIPPFTAPGDGSDPQRATFSNVPNGGRSAGAGRRRRSCIDLRRVAALPELDRCSVPVTKLRNAARGAPWTQRTKGCGGASASLRTAQRRWRPNSATACAGQPTGSGLRQPRPTSSRADGPLSVRIDRPSVQRSEASRGSGSAADHVGSAFHVSAD